MNPYRWCVFVVAAGVSSAGAGDSSLTVKDLRCEYLRNPLGIDVAKVRFSWVVSSEERGQRQTAYQILLSRTKKTLSAGIGRMWDSGKVASDRSVNVVYGGKPLRSTERYYWKVRVWDKNGRPSPWSETAYFEMGLLRPDLWQAQWIAMGSTGGPRYCEGRFGKAIELDGQNETVRLPHRNELKARHGITIVAWIKPRECSDSWREIYRKEDGEARQLLALGKDKGFFGLWCGFGINGTYVERGAPVPRDLLLDGRWHCVGVTYNGKHICLYLDGSEVGRSAVSGTLDTAGNRPAYIGSLDGREEFFAGAIDDLRLYSRALSAQEIRGLAAAVPPARGRGLLARWKLNGNLTDSVSGTSGVYVGRETSPAPHFRKTFLLKGTIRRASACVAGLGFYELFINGQRVGDGLHNPAVTAYHNDQPYPMPSRVLYVTHDVTPYLRQGRNAIGVIVGNGWYSAVGGAQGRQPYGDRPKLLFQLVLVHEDGRRRIVASDLTWKTSDGPILQNDICRGEVYDARKELPGWTLPEYDDSSWQKVIPAEPPSGTLCAQKIPPVKVRKTYQARKIYRLASGVYVYDFGQNMSGWARLTVRGPRGTRITLRYSPRSYPDGRLDRRPNRGASQTDVYILKGEGVERWEPRFTWHGFRYVELTGFPGTPTGETLVACFAYSALEEVGQFACSNDLLNRIHHNVLYTFLSSLQGIPQDAAERDERVGWLGDTGFVWEDYIYNIDMAAFTAKWLWDIRDTQRPTGELAVTAPKWHRSGQKGRRYSPFPCWISTYPLLLWYQYWYYEDTQVLRDHYEGLKRMVAYKSAEAPDHIVSYGLGDHMEPQEDGRSRFAPRHTSARLTSTAYYYYDVYLLAKIAKVLGKRKDAARYASLAEKIKHAFNKEFFNAKAGLYGSGSQTANALPLSLGMVPEAHIVEILTHLAHDISVVHKGHLSTGIIGTNALEQCLADYGLGDLIVQIATQSTPPGWGYQVRCGATTVWETWEGEPHHCTNMKMFGSTEKFFYKDCAGIVPAAPGFRRIGVRPRVVGGLTWVRARYKSVRGTIAVSWRRSERSFTMTASVPVSVSASVHVPALDLRDVQVTERGKLIWKDGAFIPQAPGIEAARRAGGAIIFEVGSGTYCFELKGSKGR